MPFQSLGYIMKLTAGFKVCPPSVLGYVGYFVRAVFTEMGKREGGTCELSGENVKTPAVKKFHHYLTVGTSIPYLIPQIFKFAFKN